MKKDYMVRMMFELSIKLVIAMPGTKENQVPR